MISVTASNAEDTMPVENQTDVAQVNISPAEEEAAEVVATKTVMETAKAEVRAVAVVVVTVTVMEKERAAEVTDVAETEMAITVVEDVEAVVETDNAIKALKKTLSMVSQLLTLLKPVVIVKDIKEKLVSNGMIMIALTVPVVEEEATRKVVLAEAIGVRMTIKKEMKR